MQELAIGKPYRHLKVGYFRKRHEDRNTKIPKRYSVHAALSLKGDWLEKAGFTTHSRVRVGVEHGKIIIELMSEDGS
ncbi:type I toxin-antitoxin system SymE family toxin [Enterobacter sp. SES19]|jgi:toxic protein SymE|uniref:SymE family type I addiction module toxin n=1 Tax=Enterobacter pseudoroggenkampii TaxID=2996112 RepID=A0ABT3XGD7_9ENTR|nr:MULTISPECIES: SymE family type I addiction module toxin [Enterobacter]MCK4229961.1 type I toxin-antitoxin system SymE family toxin [Enterobacter asburiae]MCK6904381.1 type I toxin-antitoxin system SymE family toxin [Enterobacter roggenkampii]KAE8274498.1 type I addiction module toxin, SymE family [Enterobacter sp. C6]MCX8290582.1 SymE family type I addiction module toxin [Enterobacter pseudoroggenkampii]MCX8304847.1 SymE family type I addiction module toxin [Enterobacter pseudoroggenkampii]